MKICLIDNYDSFTYNLSYLIKSAGASVDIIKNDCKNSDTFLSKSDKIVISPGPGSPEQSGICFDVLRQFAGKKDIFGVCLGHQIIGQFFGAKIVNAKRIFHGKTSIIKHTNNSIFKNIPQGIKVARYHSLEVGRIELPKSIEVIAESEYGEIMSIKHTELNIFGVQFHPESFLSEHGLNIIKNFLTT